MYIYLNNRTRGNSYKLEKMQCNTNIRSFFNTRRTDGVIFDPWDTLAVHIFGTDGNKILKF